MEGEGGGSRRECGRCGRWVTYSNYARHVSGCDGENGGGREEKGVRGEEQLGVEGVYESRVRCVEWC